MRSAKKLKKELFFGSGLFQITTYGL